MIEISLGLGITDWRGVGGDGRSVIVPTSDLTFSSALFDDQVGFDIDNGQVFSNFENYPASSLIVANGFLTISFEEAPPANRVFFYSDDFGMFRGDEATVSDTGFSWPFEAEMEEDVVYTFTIKDWASTSPILLASEGTDVFILEGEVSIGEIIDTIGFLPAEISFDGEASITRRIGGFVNTDSDWEGRLAITHRLASSDSFGADLRGHLWPPISFRGNMDSNFEEEGEVIVTRALRGFMPVEDIPTGRLNIIDTIRLNGVISGDFDVSGDFTIIPDKWLIGSVDVDFTETGNLRYATVFALASKDGWLGLFEPRNAQTPVTLSGNLSSAVIFEGNIAESDNNPILFLAERDGWLGYFDARNAVTS